MSHMSHIAHAAPSHEMHASATSRVLRFSLKRDRDATGTLIGGNQMAYTFDIYQARDGWRWRMKAPNGEIVADGSEAYVSKANALRAVAALQTEMPDDGDATVEP